MKQLILSLLFATFVFCMQSCSDDDTPIDADENFVTSVAFNLGGKKYDAVIENNEIIITVPYTISLKNATVDFKFTPSARIYPDPTTINDWDNEQIFRVVSYNGDENKYTYRVIKDDIREEGDVTLTNAEDIKNFEEKGVTIIKGNLIIGTNGEKDIKEIKDIKALKKLKQIEGKIIIKNSYKGTDLTGFDNLISIGGLQIGTKESFSTSPIHQVSFRSLTTITGDIIIYNNTTEWVMAESLTTVGGNAIINSAELQSIQMDKINAIEGNLDIQAITKDDDGEFQMGGKIVSIFFPELVSVKDTFSIDSVASLRDIKLEKLQNAGAILFKNLPLALKTIDMPEIKTVEGDLNISSSTIYHPIGSKTEGNGNLISFGGFDKLEKVGGTFTLSYFTKVTKVPNLSKASIGGYHLFHIENLNQDLDFSNTIFLKNSNEDCVVKFTQTPINRIIGQQTMECILNFQRFDLTNGFPELQNIEVLNGFILKSIRDKFDDKEVNNLKLEVNEVTGNILINTEIVGRRPHYQFPNLENVGGYFCLIDEWKDSDAGYLSDFSAPKLTSVDGQFVIIERQKEPNIGCEWHTMGDVDLNSLKKVGCAANIQYYDPTIATFSITYGNDGTIEIPVLEKVGGNGMRIGVYYLDNGITGISCPKLKTVEKKFELTGTDLPKDFIDDVLNILNFPLLTQVGNAHIEYFGALTDLSTFAPLFKNKGVTKENWSVVGCGYNPSYEDMVNGKYTEK